MNFKTIFITIFSIAFLLSNTTINAQLRVGGMASLKQVKNNLKNTTRTIKTAAKSAGMSQEEVNKRMEVENTEEFKQDRELITKLSKSLSSGKFVNDFKSYGIDFRNEVLEELVEFEAYQTLTNSLKTKYKEYFEAWDVNEQRQAMKSSRTPSQNRFFNNIGNVKGYLKSFKADATGYESVAAGYAEESMKTAEEIFETQLKASKTTDSKGNKLFSDQSTMSKNIHAVSVYLALLEVTKGKNNAEILSMRKDYEKRIAHLNSREIELLNTVKLKEEKYTEPDKETARQLIKNLWTEKYKEEVLKVVLMSAENKAFTGFDNGKWYDYDRSVLDFQIAVDAKDGTLAHVYWGTFQKDNRTGKWIPKGMFCTAKDMGYEPTKMLKQNVSE